MDGMPYDGRDTAAVPFLAPAIVRRALRVAAVGFQTLRHARGAWQLSHVPPGSLFRQFIDSRPEIRGMVLTPLISARWDARKRMAVLRQHFAIVDRQGGVIAVEPDSHEELVNLGGIRPGFHATLDSPRWLLRDGFLTISLWDAARRIHMLSFCFGEDEGEPAAFVGGLQRGTQADGTALYRELTKGAHGMRPRDLLIELLRDICHAMGVRRILAVSDAVRHQRSAYSRFWIGNDPVKTSYDDAWIDRGGTLRADGLFDLPLAAPRRAREAIAANKRTMYMARYVMLDNIRTAVGETLAARKERITERNAGVPRRREATGIDRSA